MISYRLRGLINLHVAATAMLAAGYFLLLAGCTHYTRLALYENLNIPLYAGVIAAGMLVSGRFWDHFGARFHVMKWVDAAHIASRQITVVALLVFTLVVATKDTGISRLFLAAYLLTCGILLVVVNHWLPSRLARLAFHKAHQIPTLFVGSPDTVKKLNPWIYQKEQLGVRVVGILSDEPVVQTTNETGPWLGCTDRLNALMDSRDVGQVILLEVPKQPEQMTAVVEACQAAGSRLLVYHDLLDRLPVRLTPVMEGQHLFLTGQPEPLEDPFNRALKRLFDIAVALPVVALILPPLCVIVWAVQRVQSPGPVLFGRPRGGQRGRQFYMFKFRSMHVSAPDPKLEAQQAKAGDPRIYPFGRFLRKSSLDEFPQFWNVLIGEMSIVGPRPHVPQHDQEFAQVARTYRTRQLVKPGITGLAQVQGYRGEITDPVLLQRRVAMDIEYITTWSVWLDLQITLKTALQVFRPPQTAK